MKFKKKMVVAHRGASGYAHENTLLAFQKAIDLKADCIETDIRRTKDGFIVLYHDAAINGKYLTDITFGELQEEARKKDFQVATLEEGLAYVKGKILIDIEFKEDGYVEEAVAIIQKHLRNDEFFIRSFLDEVLIQVKEIDPNIITALLLGKSNPKNPIRTRLSEIFPGRRLRRTKADFVSPHYRLLKFFFVTRMNFGKYSVSVWTVNDEEIIKKVIFRHKVDNIVSDYPDRVMKYLHK
ncbi:MAG TPA: glycerophosphodiester phosphodiesterase [Acholeplasmataceae bacterium]|jgi:glycerophosphoryl diester phosphodiesterase|nr:glycerophosphodiester phosphodiesterase [Acholeplasmataceae bacterium]